jgi:hypothetical protein
VCLLELAVDVPELRLLGAEPIVETERVGLSGSDLGGLHFVAGDDCQAGNRPGGCTGPVKVDQVSGGAAGAVFAVGADRGSEAIEEVKVGFRAGAFVAQVVLDQPAGGSVLDHAGDTDEHLGQHAFEVTVLPGVEAEILGAERPGLPSLVIGVLEKAPAFDGVGNRNFNFEY